MALKINLMKHLITTIAVFLIVNSLVFSQEKKKMELGIEIPVKVSLPYNTYQTFDYNGLIEYNAPLFDTYRNPLFGMNLYLLYPVSKTMSIGITAGVLGSFYDQHPFFQYEYQHRFILPIAIKYRYTKDLNEKLNLLADLNLGYQLTDQSYNNDSLGYYFSSTGGILAGIDLGIGFTMCDYPMSLKAGYEINQYNNTDRMDWGYGATLLTADDKISYKTYFQTIKIALEIKF